MQHSTLERSFTLTVVPRNSRTLLQLERRCLEAELALSAALDAAAKAKVVAAKKR